MKLYLNLINELYDLVSFVLFFHRFDILLKHSTIIVHNRIRSVTANERAKRRISNKLVANF